MKRTHPPAKPAARFRRRARSRWTAPHPLPIPPDVMIRCLRYFREESR